MSSLSPMFDVTNEASYDDVSSHFNEEEWARKWKVGRETLFKERLIPRISEAVLLAQQAEREEQEAIEEAKRALALALSRGQETHESSKIAAEAARRALQEQAERDRINLQKQQDFEKQLQDLLAEIERQKALLGQLKDQVGQERHTLDDVKRANADAANKLREEQSKAQELARDNERLKRELADLLAAIEAAKRDLAAAKQAEAEAKQNADRARAEAETAARQRRADEEAAGRAQEAAAAAVKQAEDAAERFREAAALAKDAEQRRIADEAAIEKLKHELARIVQLLEVTREKANVSHTNAGKAGGLCEGVQRTLVQAVRNAEQGARAHPIAVSI